MGIPTPHIDACRDKTYVKLDEPGERSQSPADIARLVVALFLIEIGHEFSVSSSRQPRRDKLSRFKGTDSSRSNGARRLLVKTFDGGGGLLIPRQGQSVSEVRHRKRIPKPRKFAGKRT
jgi:hypothetical protein